MCPQRFPAPFAYLVSLALNAYNTLNLRLRNRPDNPLDVTYWASMWRTEEDPLDISVNFALATCSCLAAGRPIDIVPEATANTAVLRVVDLNIDGEVEGVGEAELAETCCLAW